MLPHSHFGRAWRATIAGLLFGLAPWSAPGSAPGSAAFAASFEASYELVVDTTGEFSSLSTRELNIPTIINPSINTAGQIAFFGQP